MTRKIKTTATKDEATPARLPRMRFPEFRGANGWENAILGNLSEVVRGGSPRPIDGFLTAAADGLNWLKIGDVDKEAKYVTHTAEKVRPEALSKTRVVNSGDLILSNSMSFGRPYILQIKTCIHDGWIAITGIAKKADRDFLYYSISAPSSQSYFVDNAAGSGVQNLNADIIKALPVCFPSPAEQQKIASCLSSVDEVIAAQARKLAALKNHQKGLMQQLFPREGETQPRLRFPEFQKDGEWESRSVAQFAKVTTGARDTQNKVEGGKYPFFVRSQTVERIESYSYDGEAVLTSGDGVGVGKNFHHINGKFDFHQRVYCIYDFAKNVSGLFLYLYFSEHFGERVMRMSAKNSVDSVRMAMITEMPVLFPSLPEQHRIATCLSSLDALIAAETQKHAALKRHKRGLMQQLFPAPTAQEHTSEGQRPGLFPAAEANS